MGQTVGWALNVTEYVFPAVIPSYNENHDLLVRFPSGAEAEIPAMLVAPRRVGRKPENGYGEHVSVCVLYFHPNAVDIGHCIPDLYNIRDGVFKGDAVMLAPEYCGYGLLSDYRPSVDSIDLVATASWKYCRKVLGFHADQIVLWGRSIGTGPACAMAQCRAKKNLDKSGKVGSSRSLGALVLIAPMTNIEDVVMWHTNSVIASLMGPMWEVCELVKEEGLADVPLCVVHPREDEVIPFSHGEAVLESGSSKIKFCLWITGATHNFQMEREHFLMLHGFLSKHVGAKQKRRATYPVAASHDARLRSRTAQGLDTMEGSSEDRRASEGLIPFSQALPAETAKSSSFKRQDSTSDSEDRKHEVFQRIEKSMPSLLAPPSSKLSQPRIAPQSIADTSENEHKACGVDMERFGEKKDCAGGKDGIEEEGDCSESVEEIPSHMLLTEQPDA